MISFWNKWFKTRWTDDTDRLEKNFEETEKNVCKFFNSDLSLVENDSKLLKNTADQLTKTAIELTTLLERKLQLAEKKFNLVENFIDDIVVVKTANKKIININDFACEVFGVQRENCIGGTIEDMQARYPHLKETLDAFAVNENKSLEHNISVDFEITVKYNDEDIILDVTVNPVESDDSEERELIIVGHNREKIKETNPSDILFNSMPEPIVALNSNFKIYFVNKKLQEKFSINYKEVRGKGLTSLVAHELASKIIEKIKIDPFKESKINKSISCSPIVEDGKVKFYILKFN